MEKRRQNHSCEQCRKSKKACDGYLVNSGQTRLVDAALSNLGSQDLSDGVFPCSYCLKTKKTCSLNPHWARRHRPTNGQSLIPPEDSSLDDARPHLKRQRFQPPENASVEPLAAANVVPCFDPLVQLLQTSPQESDILGWDGQSAPGAPISISSSNSGEATPGYRESVSLEDLRRLSSIPACDNRPVDQILCSDLNSFVNPGITDGSSDSSTVDAQSAFFGLFNELPTQRSSISSSSSSPWVDRQGELRWRQLQRKDPMNIREHYDMSLSRFGVDHLVMQNSNRSLISDSLLRIYHDVLENNLACWLVEDTCPYKLQRRRCTLLPTQQSLIPGAQVDPEWGVAWSNRMYRRVRQLDRYAQSVKLIRLTASENQAAFRALNLAIMAFATQWAQGKRRWEGLRSTSRCEDEMGCEDEEFGDEFEQNLQESIWEQAKKALHDVSDVECFRVVFAELIFGLILKPSSRHKYDQGATGRPATRDQGESVKPSVLQEVMNIIAQEEPPVFTERAARKIHALKFRLEARQAGFQEVARSCRTEMDGDVPQGMSTEESRTVGLLYWLAVMFDTLSSSIHERPVVVPDEECQHDEAAQRATRAHTKRPILNRRWELDLYAQDNTEKPMPLHWPCPYEVATNAVARSAAVKVLLFRHISYLQNALRNLEHGQAIEEIIHTVLSVCRYWDMTHGAFFRDLTRNYESIPARIKSWFPCIAIPWHLGALMLADLIDFVDDNGLGCDDYRAKRLVVSLAAKIRKASSIELADLAAVITSRGGGTGLKQLPDFHFAVNESPLLTEPWTVLLIRAFTKACIFHLDETEKLRNHQWFTLGHESEALQTSIARVESCVRALRFLGTKSGMAEAISIVLSRSLDACGNMQGVDFLPSQAPVF